MEKNINMVVEHQRKFFNTKETLDINKRIYYLKKLKSVILKYENEINQALYEDLGKSPSESYMCEVGLTLSELSYQIKHIKRWSRAKRHITDLTNFHGKSYSVFEPYGVVLVMAPWNYPFMLTMEPLIGAVAAGNCVVAKPSAYSPATSSIIKKILEQVFDDSYVAVVEGGRAENTELLEQRFDYIFFTGGVNVGKLVMEKAAKNLTPVSLELGGKSPCIIDKTANLKLAAKRLAFGKYLNLGQTCVAPDYLLIEETVKEKFLNILIDTVKKMYGENPLENQNYGKMINEKHYRRVMGLIDERKVILGGKGIEEQLRIEPTVLDNVTESDDVMQEEIFGPVLPVITYKEINDAVQFIETRPHPLALYIFSNDRKVQKLFTEKVTFGGGCINDTILHLATSRMGFGGVGNSGMGAYHGIKSFQTFSHEKSILRKYNWIDMPMRYQPYTKIMDKLVRMFLK
ncbi:aldehyde dehydrogenase [uncultured Eubacterium sp.]|uniref:aldehyde dehydrogenase n=1 Tax=uncultured Eubacterium sp. TaxID=165185 RepID=UPI002673A996|nr:aldehyde dehydrogenase [uncultured Eubacterium sp.]